MPHQYRNEPAGSTILLVEDDDDVRAALADTLHMLGYRIHEAANGQDALATARAIEEPIDLVISDYIMPGMNALGLYEGLKAICKEADMLIITGYPMPFSEMVIDDGRNIRWSSKPIGVRDLERLVEQMLRRRSTEL